MQKLEDQEPNVLPQNESKGIIVNDFLFSYNFEDSDFDHAKLPSEDESDIKILIDEISRLTFACKYQEKLLQICDDKEAKLKEEIMSLKIKLEKSKKVEEGMRIQYKEKEYDCERLEYEVVSLRK